MTEPAHKAELADWDNAALAAFAVREIQRADGGNPHEHQDGGEQDDNNQGSLLVLSTWEQLNRQALTVLLISGLCFQRFSQKVTEQGHLLTQISCTHCTGTGLRGTLRAQSLIPLLA